VTGFVQDAKDRAASGELPDLAMNLITLNSYLEGVRLFDRFSADVDGAKVPPGADKVTSAPAEEPLHAESYIGR
jgi:hypothetical protein